MILKAAGTLTQRHASPACHHAPSAGRYATPANLEEPKITYPSRRLAVDVSKQNGMRVYRCGTCRHWHLTSSDKAKPNKRGRRS